MDLKHYHLIAGLFDYPHVAFCGNVQKILIYLQEHYPESAKDVDLFYVNLPTGDLDKMQELFTRSFDVQAITTLDIGYVLFGDDYKRGELLANLNREHKQAQNDCGSELADYLPNILRLLSKLKDEELVKDLVGEILVPALGKMIAEFDPERLVKKNTLYKKHYKTLIETPQDKAAIYGHVLKALNLILKKDFNIQKQTMAPEHGRDFLKSISTEMAVEKVAGE